MLYRQLIAIVVRLFNPRAGLAPCRVVVRKSLPCIFCVVALCGARTAIATVAYTGVVYPVDNPFDPRGVTGIPRDGNDFFLFEDEDHQTYYEGYHQDNGVNAIDDTPGITTDDINVNMDVVVGAGAPGTLQITEVALRDMNLVIGDIGSGDINGRGDYSLAPNYSYQPLLADRVGSGVVRITGLGAVFNSNFEILASGLNPGIFQSAVPRNGAASPFELDDSAQGFDLYVGRGGNGTLEISVGGRAEIHDSVAVGLAPGTVGNIIVDGFDSYLGSAGLGQGISDLPVGSGGSGQPLPGMYVGVLGTGIVTVRNGGTMQTQTNIPATSNNPVPVAVLGGTPSTFTGNDIPDQGGTGIVTVTGNGSKWLVGGTLQIGGFNLGTNGVGGGIDFEGDDIIYNSQAGRGTLNVADSGLVDINLAAPTTVTDPTLYLAIGRFGRLNVATGGLVNIGGGTDQNPRSRDVVIFNDGVISGSGRIQTGVFLNRYQGEVRVTAGEKLVIDAEAEYRLAAPVPGGNPATPGSPIAPLVNYGVIQVFGTQDSKAEIEFDRAPNEPTNNPIQPMRNERVIRPTGAPIGDFYGGLISAQHSILRFRSGLINTGMMAFTAGNNYVTGNVLNADVPMSPDDGIITISGPGTKVTFENDLLAPGGGITVGPGATLEVLARHSFLTAGDLKVTLDPDETSNIFVAGDAGIAGQLSISLSGFGPGDLQIGDSFQIMSVGGNMGGVDLTNPLNPKIDFTQAPLFSLVSFPNLAAFGLPATTVLRPIFAAHSVSVVVASAAGAIGPDFNGDGVINGLDLNVWLANVGITSGASVVQGDADGDGDVDGDDFLFWQRNVGQPGPWTGAGSGMEASVPEPSSLVLLLISSAFSLAFRRRR